MHKNHQARLLKTLIVAAPSPNLTHLGRDRDCTSKEHSRCFNAGGWDQNWRNTGSAVPIVTSLDSHTVVPDKRRGNHSWSPLCSHYRSGLQHTKGSALRMVKWGRKGRADFENWVLNPSCL